MEPNADHSPSELLTCWDSMGIRGRCHASVCETEPSYDLLFAAERLRFWHVHAVKSRPIARPPAAVANLRAFGHPGNQDRINPAFHAGTGGLHPAENQPFKI